MIETFTALLFAHVLADFVLQSSWMAKNKASPSVMLLHGGLVLATAQAATGHVAAVELLALAAAHVVIDSVKAWGSFRSFTAFVTDQAAHIVTLITVAAAAPDLWSTGAWAQIPAALPAMAILAGLIIALPAGQHAIAALIRPHSVRVRSNGLRDGGRQIGLLERGLIFLFMLTHLPLAVGFLVGAKSILRFGTASQDQRTAEYVIIGTLASFGWALLAAWATQTLLHVLPPLEMPGRPN